MSEKSVKAAATTRQELEQICAFLEQRSGILFDSSRERFLSTRVQEYLAERRLPGTADLLLRLQSSGAEYNAFLERLLTQETCFFRYPAVFEAFGKRVLSEIQANKFWANPRTLRIWSAGCATGEEPYSIAISIADGLLFADAWNIEILATDISRQALQIAERGVYSARSVANLTPKQVQTHFEPCGNEYVVRPRIRRLVSFVQMNLADLSYVGRMDCIFCMNVMMYFSEERRNALLRHFYNYLEPGGYLFLGHSESIAKAPVRFASLIEGDCILYRKAGQQPASRRAAVVEESR